MTYKISNCTIETAKRTSKRVCLKIHENSPTTNANKKRFPPPHAMPALGKCYSREVCRIRHTLTTRYDCMNNTMINSLLNVPHHRRSNRNKTETREVNEAIEKSRSRTSSLQSPFSSSSKQSHLIFSIQRYPSHQLGIFCDVLIEFFPVVWILRGSLIG